MKRHYLSWWDLGILTLILFGPAIWSSTAVLIQPSPEAIHTGTEFTSSDNFYAILTQSLQLGLAFSYLWMRRFEFSRWHFRISWRGTLFGAGLFLLLGFCMDLLSLLTGGRSWLAELSPESVPVLHVLSVFHDVPLVLFSLLNGIYEELFFLGICTAVEEKNQGPAFCWALLVRISFHTYQGLTSALGIGLILGTIYYVLYRNYENNLYPYLFSHALGDLFGLSFLQFL